MFLDVDHDGEYSSADANVFISFDTATVDVYLVTNRDQFGSPRSCTDGSEPGLRGYAINLYSIDAPFSVDSVANQMPGMVQTVPLVTHPYSLSVWYSGGRTFPPGKYLLMRITMRLLPTTLSAGCGALIFVPSNCYSPPGLVTGFESDCPGASGDGLLRLGEDWSDTGNLWGCTDNTGRAPTLSCPAEVTGREGQALSFAGTVTDPDCSVPSFFTYRVPPGATVSAPSPFVSGESSQTITWTPASGQAGTYDFTFEASDPDPFNFRDRRTTCTTHATILPAVTVQPARVFTTSENRVTRFPRGKPYTCFQIEPASGPSFALEDIVPSSLRIHYAGSTCGDHDVASAAAKAPKIKDSDGNGVPELDACFAQDALATLAPCLSSGTQDLTLEVWGSLVNGDLIRGDLSHSFQQTGSGLAAISPNPLRTGSAVEFMTTREGFARVQIFDVHGRWIATFMDEPSATAGYHRISLLGGSPPGARLASGVYFVRVATQHDGSETRAVTVLR
jgi:hypothetical protein